MKLTACLILAAISQFLLTATGACAVAEDEPLRLHVQLVDGSRIIGVPALEAVLFKTSYADMTIPLRKILSIDRNEEDNSVVMSLRNGDRLQGRLGLDSIDMATIFGKASARMAVVRRVTVRLPDSVNLPPALAKGLVLRYSLDTPGEEVNDSSGKGNHGKVKGAGFIAGGRLGGAYRFSGGAEYIEMNLGALRKSSDDSFAVAAWFRAEEHNGRGGRNIFGIGGPNGPDNGKFAYTLMINPNGHGLGFGSGRHCYGNNETPLYTVPTDQWQHMVGVYDRGSIKLYVDGIERTNVKFTLGQAAAATQLVGSIGNNLGDVNSRGFKGAVDEVMFFERALSGEEVRDLYRAVGGK